ncbi:MAG: hypothetical protein ACLRP3_10180 [Escherichia sp.]
MHNLGGMPGAWLADAVLYFWRDGLHHSRHYCRRLLVCLASSVQRRIH